MSKTVALINIKPNNAGTPELAEMLKHFQAEDEKLSGVVQVPKDNYLITEEGHLVILFPHRIDFAVGLEPDEFMIMAEKEVEDEE